MPKKFEGTLVAVEHGGKPSDVSSVRRVMPRFKKLVAARRGKKLFIEMTRKLLRLITENPRLRAYGYCLLVKSALKAGMKVVPIESRKKRRLVNRMTRAGLSQRGWEQVREEAHALGISQASFITYMHWQGSAELREKIWANKLRQARQGDLAVMHPGHAHRIAPRLGISRKQVVWLHKPDQTLLELVNRVWLSRKNAGRFRELRRKLGEKRIAEK